VADRPGLLCRHCSEPVQRDATAATGWRHVAGSVDCEHGMAQPSPEQLRAFLLGGLD
jgi:hypothetical protein